MFKLNVPVFRCFKLGSISYSKVELVTNQCYGANLLKCKQVAFYDEMLSLLNLSVILTFFVNNRIFSVSCIL